MTLDQSAICLLGVQALFGLGVSAPNRILDPGSLNPGVRSQKPADMAVCPPSVHRLSPRTDSGLQSLTQPQIEPTTSNLQFPVHPLSHCPAHPTTHLCSQFVTAWTKVTVTVALLVFGFCVSGVFAMNGFILIPLIVGFEKCLFKEGIDIG